MKMTAKVNFVRITPRKLGLIADEVRGKPVNAAYDYLRFSPRKRTAQVLLKLIQSAVANYTAKSTNVDIDRIYVETLLVGQGTTLKRFRPRAKGSAFRINKKTSHVSVMLAQRY